MQNGRADRGDRVLLGIGFVVLTLLAYLGVAWFAGSRLNASMSRLQKTEIALFDDAWQVRYLDEGLTHSAAQFVLTGDFVWQARYDAQVTKLDAVLLDLRTRGNPKILRYLDQVSTANAVLIGLETRAFSAVRSGDRDTAKLLLTGAYAKQKTAYQQGLEHFFDGQRLSIVNAVQNARKQSYVLRFAAAVLTAVMSCALVILTVIHRRQVRAIKERDDERDLTLSRQSFDQRLGRALDMAQNEEQILASVQSILTVELPHGPAELLLADSSRAHLRQVATTDQATRRPACGVVSPHECPAIRWGSTLTFDDPTSYDACPHLLSRNLTGCTAVCAPVSVTGLTVGVLHTLIETDRSEESVAHTIRIAERVGSRAGERLSVIRAFAQTQLQASTDPLTGLLNRRSLEERAVELLHEDAHAAVVFCDLDHFKAINDMHGHETGDRVLRLFSKVLRDCTRSTDIVGRWGGEEFVIVLPGAEPDLASMLYRRIQESLVLASALGNCPMITTSVGVAVHSGSETFLATVARADVALLRAKRDGRDRLVLADDVKPLSNEEQEVAIASGPLVDSGDRLP